MTNYLKYSVLESTIDGSVYRILDIFNKSKKAVLIELKTNKLNIVKEDVDNLSTEYKAKEHVDAFLAKTASEMTSAEITVFKKRVQVIDFVEEKFDDIEIYGKTYRANIRKQVVEKGLVGKSAFYDILRTYLQAGRSKSALVPSIASRGGKGNIKNFKSKPGKPKGSKKMLNGKYHTKSESVGVILNDEHRAIMRKTLLDFYYSSKSMSLAQTHREMIANYYFGVTNNDIPSINQLSFYKKKMEKEGFGALIKNRLGDKAFNLTGRHMLSSSKETGDTPGATFEIDASIPNVQLVDETKEYVIGTPILYLVVDTFTKLIVGMHVGLDHPSWNVASSALYNVTEDKVKFCKKHGIEITPDKWVNTGLPRAILADKGEFAGSMPEDIVKYLGVEIRNTPSGRPDLKPNVERFFKLIEDRVNGYLPGFKLTPKQRGDRDPQIDAVFTIETITQVFIEAVLFVNNHLFKEYDSTIDMMYEKVASTPNQLWKWGAENIGNESFYRDDKKIKYALMKSATASITETGVSLGNLNYTCEEFEDEDKFIWARNKGRKKIEVKFDERNMNFIYLFIDDEDNNNQIITLKQTEKTDRVFHNLSYTEILYIEELRTDANNEAMDANNANDSGFINQMKHMAKQAKKDAKSLGVKRATSAEKKANRKVEADRVRPNQAINADEMDKQVEYIPEENNELSLEEKKRQAMMKKYYK